MIYQDNRLVNIAFISKRAECEHLMKQNVSYCAHLVEKTGITCLN